MANVKAAIPKGTRDFGPVVMIRRNYIFDTIKKVFKKYGYQEIQTPTMENLDTLTGKYGDEGDQLIFKIINSGDYFSKAEGKENITSKSLLPLISEKALRYDLTVPFARYVVMHQNEITSPFKRFQIQPVWRADRPQKGRYREFYQCDADVVGSDSLLNEAEFICIYDEALSALGLQDFTIKINNRKILSGIAELIGKPDMIVDMTVAIDKLDKIGLDGVVKELLDKGFEEKDISILKPVILLSGNNQEKLNSLKTVLKNSEIGLNGVAEIEKIFSYLSNFSLQKAKVELDLTLARGLNYYTGCIFEVKTNEAAMGSIGGGGRYDDLTGMFGKDGLTGVGISFGADRIYDVLEELNLFPSTQTESTKVLICVFGEAEEAFAIPILNQLRLADINAELFPFGAKMKKQMQYANDKAIPYVVIIGGDEMQSGLLSLKNMESGEQVKVSVDDLINRLT
ncbi:histidine--tRNA ligase [Pedobacter psychrophilus]|uniref:Histidine--tRNA ligase n=1 Tax=Pedobacter psychrophilus TaxID=1826909 RepID=A0A179DDD9_9SPHI|nr:histidine--tRNA ligase [Pedobacter psychrophilus]OAQ39055.1 histidine--tRNA ligase [Pedobacter psychrophilus]